MALAALFVSTAAVAQIPTLPWNPDENGDQFIGLPDLLGLLTVYGQEFENAIVAEDGESAIMYVGEMHRSDCEYSCRNLPGFWDLPELGDLSPVLPVSSAWLKSTWIESNMKQYACLMGSPLGVLGVANPVSSAKGCYCTAKQLPRVEYDYCRVDAQNNELAYSQLKTCINSKLQDGWQLFGSSRDGEDESVLIQAFWRFAQ